MRFIFSFCLSLGLSITLPVFAQESVIQWASELDFQFNQHGDVEYSGYEAIGPPNAKIGVLSPKAFRLNKEAAFGTLVLNYSKPQKIRQIVIFENNEPGRIAEVVVFDTKGIKHSIYKNNPGKLDDAYRALIIPVPQTHYLVKKVEINLNTITSPGWSQIDAVGISDADLALFKKEVNKYGDFNTDTEVVFTSEKTNLGKNINTNFIETKPIISPDGKTLYFCRQNYPDNVRGVKDDQDIYISTLKNGQWLPAINAGEPLNDKYPNGVGSVSPDGNTLLLINAYDEKGNIQPGASISKKQRNGWSAPKKLNIRNLVNNSPYQDYYLANNGRVLILAVEGKNSVGDQDLYVSFAQADGSWSEPLNMGNNINTTGAEFSPFLAADNKTLYFASDGHKGLGASDIFYTKRLDDSWTKWSKPKNLGPSVNTKDIDGYYAISASGELAYFVSTQGGMGGSRDIFSIALPSEFKPEPVLLVKGKVFNQKTNLAVEADIIISALPEGTEEGVANSAPYTGDYQLVLPQGKNYSVRAVAKGFLAVEQNLNLAHINEYQEVEQNLYLAPIEVNQTITLNNVYFFQGKSEMQTESFPELGRLVEFLKSNKTITIELGGHTDNQGVSKSNMDLSEQRVQVVKQYLVNQGIESKRINTKAYGGTRPLFSNSNEEGRAKNRRVDMTILTY